MNQKLLYRLKGWRVMQAQQEGVELFRVLPNVTLEEIARVLPKTSKEFLQIKGIKEGRFKKYGAALLTMVADALEDTNTHDATSELITADISTHEEVQEDAIAEDDLSPAIPGQRTLYTVSDFLEALNVLFAEMTVRVQGEVSSVDIRATAIYFTLKDSQDGSVLSCLIFRYQYDVAGVSLAVGQEVIVEGVPGIWKPTGRLSLKAQSLEVSGEGALQKAYNDLKQKLEKEGLFALDVKKTIQPYPSRIALITSQQGAAIGDFMMNLGKFGFKISLFNVSVEGKKAVFDLLEAVKFFDARADQYDVLVIIRGGGSLESLQAFNNEALVRAVAHSKLPTLCGIGHEKDVSLVALAGDVMVSTPTATARFLRDSFEKADATIIRYEQKIVAGFSEMLSDAKLTYDTHGRQLLQRLQFVKEKYTRVQNAFIRSAEKMQLSMHTLRLRYTQLAQTIVNKYEAALLFTGEKIKQSETKMKASDPRRLLQLGYSLVMKNGKIIRKHTQLRVSDTVTIVLADGTAEAMIREA